MGYSQPGRRARRKHQRDSTPDPTHGTVPDGPANPAVAAPPDDHDHMTDHDSIESVPTTVAVMSTRDLRNVRRWIAVSVVAVVLTLVIAAVTTVAATARTNATTLGDETTQRIGRRTADLVAAHFDGAAATLVQVETLATADVLETRDAGLDRILAAALIAYPQLSGAYVGFPDGGFRFVLRDGDELVARHVDTAPAYHATDSVLGPDLSVVSTEQVDTDYDPRQRPWYEAAVATTDAVWTDPYVFFRSGEPGVTLARSCLDADGDVVAVIGVDVSLAELRRFLEDLPIDEGADAFLVAGSTVVAAPASHPASEVTTDGELPGVEALGLTEEELGELAGGTTTLEIDEDRRVHRIELDEADAPLWSVVITTDHIGVVEALDQRARVAIVAILLAGLVLVVATPLLTRWLRRPIEELSRRAHTDSLTEVANRQAFLDEAGLAAAIARRERTELVVAIVDVDNFKEINDQHGHRVGDEVLQRLGRSLRAATRPIDLIGRLGGDEFGIAIIDLDRATANAILERIQQVATAAAEVEIEVTIGASALGGRNIELPTLINEADQALLRSKREHKGTIAWHA